MINLDTFINSTKVILSQFDGPLDTGLVLVQQIGEDAGRTTNISLAKSNAFSGNQKVIDAIEAYLLMDGNNPVGLFSDYDLHPIAGEFGRPIGFIWNYSHTHSDGLLQYFNATASSIAAIVESDKKSQFHQNFQSTISDADNESIFPLILSLLERGLFAQKVVVWELKESTLKSVSASDIDIPNGRGFVQKALDGNVHRLESVDQYEEEIYFPEFFVRNNVKSALTIPIRNHIKDDPSPLIGVVGVFYRRPNGITEIDQSLCLYAVEYFGMIWSLRKEIQNREELIGSYDVTTDFVRQAANALVDYHDINSIQIGLASAISSASILSSNKDVEEKLDFASKRIGQIRKIIADNRHILAMARDLSKHFQIDTDDEVKVFDITSVVQHEIDDVVAELDADRAIVSSKFHLPNHVVRMSIGDLQRVIRNLLTNAMRSIHYRNTGGGKIDLLVYQPQPHKIAVKVHDNGPGIEPGKTQLIFEPFYTTHAQEGGRGIGLFAVRSIANKYGGEPKVRTKWGHFAEFEVWLNVSE